MGGETQPPAEVEYLPEPNDIAETLPAEQLEQNENESSGIQGGLANSQIELINKVNPMVEGDDAEELEAAAAENNIRLLLSRFYAENEAYGEAQILSSGISKELDAIGFTLETYMFVQPSPQDLDNEVTGETMRFAVEIPDVSLVLGAERSLEGGTTAITADVTVFDNGKFIIMPYATANITDRTGEMSIDPGILFMDNNFYLEGNVFDVGGDRSFSLLASNEVGHGINVYASIEAAAGGGAITTGIQGRF